MSDPFDPFNSGGETMAVSSSSVGGGGFDDPAADFLAREQAEFAQIENLGLGETDTENAFDIINSETQINAGQSEEQNGFVEPSANDPYSSISRVDKLAQEPEKIKRWREEQKLRLTTKDAEEEQKKQDWKEAAKKELEDWYKNRQEQLTKTHANNKVNNKAAEAELVASRESTTQGGTEWDRVTKLCDFNPKANKNLKDVARMRSILLQLKQQPLRPGPAKTLTTASN